MIRPTTPRPSFARFLIVTLLALPALVQAQAKRQMTEDDLMRLQAVGGVALSPAGDRVLYAVSAWEHANAKSDTALGDKHDRRSHIWIVPATGGTARQLTTGERGESQPQWSPDGSMISFVSARCAGTGDHAPRRRSGSSMPMVARDGP